MARYTSSMDNDNLERPAEAALIEKARKRLFPPVSIAKAAKMSGLSTSRYSNIEKGFRWVSKGIRQPDVVPAETLARIAEALDIGPRELREVNRPDAAHIRQQALRFRQEQEQRAGEELHLQDVPTNDLLAEIRRRIDGAGEAAPLVARRIDPNDRSTFQ